VLQDFTADRNRLLSILETLVVARGKAQLTQLMTQQRGHGRSIGQDDSEFNIFNKTGSSLPCRRPPECWTMSEKKSLIYSKRPALNGVDNIAQLHATIDAAVRAGVTFGRRCSWIVASAPLGDATQANSGMPVCTTARWAGLR